MKIILFYYKITELPSKPPQGAIIFHGGKKYYRPTSLQISS